jgi:tetratricopeptide (TPR) repeat protein
MKLLLAFLAEHAIAHDDGRFYALGGGLDTLEAESFPSRPQNLTLLVRFGFEQDELGRSYIVEVAGFGPDGKAFVPTAGLALKAANREGPVPGTFQFAHQLPGIRFSMPGLYYFSIRISGVEAGRVEVRVSQASAKETGNTLTEYMAQGYAAFRAGDLATAEQLFQIITEQFPDSAEGHNNLGFVRLVAKNVEGALRSFEIAEQIGFAPEQILKANIATCWFVLGRPQDALLVFSRLLGEASPAAGSILIALGRTAYHVVRLTSQTDAVVLMALNAGRSAMSAGDRTLAKTFLDLSGAAEFSNSPTTIELFAALRGELADDLKAVGHTRGV